MIVRCTDPRGVVDRIFKIFEDPGNTRGEYVPITTPGVTIEDINRFMERLEPPPVGNAKPPSSEDPGQEELKRIRALRMLNGMQSRCQSCRCHSEFMAIIRGNRHGCRSQHHADVCAAIYGCYCTAILDSHHPPPLGENFYNQNDYQQAYDQIPQFIKDDNPHFQWSYGRMKITTQAVSLENALLPYGNMYNPEFEDIWGLGKPPDTAHLANFWKWWDHRPGGSGGAGGFGGSGGFGDAGAGSGVGVS
ncbi:hypothetical protein TWF730_002622 [Orbilia blumenaviensis]|uniref:Uncharacterized protein n=1 Tax=Orbilia blumenaviensis TaxID=1796055 RepID=A0AAV9UBA3_9PEZI